MNKRMEFIWIDDNPNRKRSAENLKKSTKIKTLFINVKNKVLNEELQSIMEGNREPDLILIDHKLNNVSDGVINTGSTASEVIRERWNECPIVCITGVDLKNISLHRQSIYEEVIDVNKLSDYYSLIVSIAQSYRFMKKSRPKDVSGIIRLIEAPEVDIVRLTNVMPVSLKVHFDDKSLLMNISKWVRQLLFTRPGFLYDKLWAATLLGIKVQSFYKIQKYFIKAKYSGIFKNENNERWWQSQLRSILGFKVPTSELILPRELGRNLPGIKKRDYSICYVCGKELPETVAYIDTPKSKQEPMHLRCTETHPNFETSLYFDEIRVMKVAE